MRISDWSSDVCSSDLRDIWSTMRHADGPLTSHFLLAALDLRLDVDERIIGVAPEQAVFGDIYLRTFKISAVVALLCVVLGYPVAYLLASLPDRRANPLLILVLLPFWTSALVRTADRKSTRVNSSN